MYRQWQDSQMLAKAARPASMTAPAAAPPQYRPSDQSRFHCHPAPQFGQDYVFCGFDAGPPP
jgi:hypothetical protein